MSDDSTVAVPDLEVAPPPGEGTRRFSPEAPPGGDYVEAEYFLAGEAAGDHYRTKCNVRRPSDAEDGSGTAVVEAVHESGYWPVRSTVGDYLTHEGHASVAIASSPTVVERVVGGHDGEYDQTRYADLHVPHRDGVESEILAQFGALLEADELPGVDATHAILAGFSNTGAKTRTYVDERHEAARVGGGPVYDGYFLGQTAVGTHPEAVADLDVPVVELQGEREVIATLERNPDGLTYRRPDGEHYRLYEVPGMPHVDTRGSDPLFPPEAVAEDCVPRVPDVDGLDVDGATVSDFPLVREWHVALDHLVDWVRTGDAPPAADRIELDGESVRRDEHGNAVGGKRTPLVEVPSAAYASLRRYGVPEDETPVRCDMLGTRIPFTDEKFEALYGDGESYVAAFEERLDELVADGWYLERDAADLLESLDPDPF